MYQSQSQSIESIESFYILLVEKCGRKDLYSPNLFNNTKKEQEVLPAGTILRLLRVQKQSENYLLEIVGNADIQVTCKKAEIDKICGWEISYIVSIPSLKERLEVFKDKEWLKDGKKLKEGDSVYVKIKDEQVEGTVRLKEDLNGRGMIFGVQLNESKGTSDGVYKEGRYFQTGPNQAIFTTLNKIQVHREGWSKRSRLRVDVEGMPYNKSEMSNNSQLRLGERVVWISDDGPQKGTVRWYGILPDDPSDNVTVGVEFDEPIGSGTGKYKDNRLFFTRQAHASLVPLMGLMREEDLEDPPKNDYSSQMRHTDHDFIKQQQKLQSGKQGYSSYPDMVPKGPQITDHAFPKPLPENYENCVDEYKSSYPDIDVWSKGQTRVTVPSQYQKSSLPTHFNAECSVEDYDRYNVPIVEEEEGYKKDHFSRNNENLIRKEVKTNGLRVKGLHDSEQDLKINDPVQVKLRETLFGIIRWIGVIDSKQIAGLEMEKEVNVGTDGTYINKRYFHCPPKRAFFVPLYKCQKDKRSAVTGDKKQEFGGEPTPEVEGDIPPAEIVSDRDFKEICGKHRGIQGHHNSCYLDASLFCMFYFTTVFDFIYNRPSNSEDREEYPQVQKVLREKIVNPLRMYHYVRADNVLELRDLLDRLGTVPGMMGEEKDPEEFLNALLSQIMRADPLLKLSTGEDSFFYQLFMEKDENLLLPTTQKLVELSFLQGNVKLKKVPSCLMIQMPRFGKDYKMFHRIVPSLQLDITHILENHPRDCIVCGGLATHECQDCYQVHGPGLNTTAFCDNCVRKSHQHKTRRNHKPQPLNMEPDFLAHYNSISAFGNADNLVSLQHEIMELFAVICIQTSHYVSFVKCGSGKDAPWVFFDSMADRMGEQGGYNIPEVVHVPQVSEWLSESNFTQLLQNGDDRELPEHLRRLLCDGYMCMYQSPTVMMFQ